MSTNKLMFGPVVLEIGEFLINETLLYHIYYKTQYIYNTKHIV